jgi:hypothetical protein
VNSEIIEILRRLQCSDAACGDLRIAMGAKLAIYEIEHLRAERDEARREVCRNNHQQGGVMPHHYAKSRGWDCFNDKTEADTNNTLFRTTDGE